MPQPLEQISVRTDAEVSAPDPGGLIELLDRQLSVMARLKELSEQQRDLISREDPTALLAVLGQRQQAVEELSRLDLRLAPTRRDWQRIAPLLPPGVRGRAQRSFARARDLLARIIASDQQASAMLTVRKSSIGQALRSIDAGRQACAAYAGGAVPESRYLDRTDVTT